MAGAYTIRGANDRVSMKLTVLPVVSEIAAGHSSKDVRAPSNVSGNFVWWKRRARGAFYTCWWVSILLFGVLINVISLAGFGQEALIVLAIMMIFRTRTRTRYPRPEFRNQRPPSETVSRIWSGAGSAISLVGPLPISDR